MPITFRIERYQIITTRTWVFEVHERFNGHSSIKLVDGVQMGSVGSRRLPAELDALPAMTDERIDRVRAWHDAQYEEAYQAIVKAFPEAADGSRSMGSIAINGPTDDYYPRETVIEVAA